MLNDFLILTGSKSRPSLPLLKWIDDPIVFIEPQEEALYRKTHPNLSFFVMQKNDMGFAYLMNQMADFTISRGQRYFVFTDDDVTGIKLRPNMMEKFISIKNYEVKTALDALVSEAKKDELAQLTLSFSGQSWGVKKAFQDNVGAWGVHITDAWVVKKLGGYDEKLLIFNDWEMSARMIKCRHQTRRTNLLSFVHKMKSMDGGAQKIYEQKLAVRKAAERVQWLYPEACKVIYVPEHDLYEIRFNWKKLLRRA